MAMAGLIVIDDDWKLPGPMVDDPVFIWAASEAEEWEGRVEFLPLR
jgi:hypothetical protein